MKRLCTLLVAALIAALGMGLYVSRVMLPFEQRRDVEEGVPGGYMADLYPRWVGARELLLHGRDPYSDEVTREIQAAYYGRPLSPQEHKDEQRFAYPVYIVFLLAPTIHLPFVVVQYLAVVLLGMATAWSVPLWLRFTGWKLASGEAVAITVLVLASPPVVQGLRLQQLGLLAAFLIAASSACALRGRFFWAGALLAMATIKPQMAMLPVLWWWFWAVIRWRERKSLVLGFVVMMAVLVGAGELVLPGWLSRFYQGVAAYGRYAGTTSVLQLILGGKTGAILDGLALAGVGVFCWQRRQQSEEALSMALAVGRLALPPTYHQVLQLPGIFLVLSHWPRGWLRRITLLALGAAIGFPWITAIVLVLFQRGPATLPFYSGFALSFLLPLALVQYARRGAAGRESHAESVVVGE